MEINRIDLSILDQKERLQVLTLLSYAWAIATDNNVDESDSFLAENICHNFGVQMNCEDASHVANYGPFDMVDIIKDILVVCPECGLVRHNLESECPTDGVTTVLNLRLPKEEDICEHCGWY